MAEKIALFIWINDDPITGNVLRISNIVHPRCGYDDYKVGQKVLVKCPGMGKFEAMIGKIGQPAEKKNLEQILKGADFLQLLSSLKLTTDQSGSEEQNAEINDDSQKSDQSASNSSSESDKVAEKFSQSSGKVVKPKPVKRKVAFSEEQQTVKLTTDQSGSEEQNAEVNDDSQKSDQPASNSSSESDKVAEKFSQSTGKVVKPKPVKRKVAFSEEQQTVKQKKLEQAAEDIALCDLSRNTNDASETSTLVGKSMTVLNDSPYKLSPRHSPRQQKVQSPLKCCDHQIEIFTLRSTLANLEYWCRTMWDEIMNIKSEMARKQYGGDSSFQALLGHNPTSTAELMNTPSAQPRSSSALSYASTPSSENSTIQDLTLSPPVSTPSISATFRGYTKEQVMEELSLQKDFKKGTTRIFRMLFSAEEITGRSLSGQRGNTGDLRPQIEDRRKLKFLEDCVKEEWPAVSNVQIRHVIRHLLKPSRNKKQLKNQDNFNNELE